MRIALRDLHKRFGPAVAVDGLSLDVRPGELVSLVGGPPRRSTPSPLWVDVSHAQARALERKKPVALAFAPDDCVVLAAAASGP